MKAVPSRFFVTGGTLPREALSYIPRRADSDLYEGLLQGEFCYVLTSRQMGKSSLMVRTAFRLREARVDVVVVDLTALGKNMTAAQWYDSLLAEIADQLGLEMELDDFCAANRALHPLQRWRGAMREIVLKWRKQPIVVFIDEIDVTRSLPFSTDEFFAAIRELYNSRSREPELNGLTFCLLGVATPSDLIQDTRTTPFNIGKRIELTDFTPDEAAPLAAGLIGLSDPKSCNLTLGVKLLRGSRMHAGRQDAGVALLTRILHWTGGHPYLTQKLCQAVSDALRGSRAIRTADGVLSGDATASHPPARTGESGRSPVSNAPALVDRLCAQMYFGVEAENRDDNLAFVRNRLLNNQDADPAKLLLLYAQVWRGRPVMADDTDVSVSVLYLSGIVRKVRGMLVPRNRIYAQVFHGKWVRSHLPGAELRRLRAAFLRGVLRASGVFALLAMVVGGLAFWAMGEARRADQNAAEADRLRYVSDMNVAQQEWEEGGVGRALELLEAHQAETDLRDFEWRYLWAQCHQARRVLPAGQGSLLSMAVSPDGRLLATGSAKGTIKLWNTATWRVVATLYGHTNFVLALTFSPDGKTLASSSQDTTVRLWDLTANLRSVTLRDHRQRVFTVAFSPNGRMLATADAQARLVIWDVATSQRVNTLICASSVKVVAFSPDNNVLATGDSNGQVRFWNTKTWIQVGKVLSLPKGVDCLNFAHNGRLLATGGDEGTVVLWNVTTGRKIGRFEKHSGRMASVVFSRDDRTLATASWDDTINLWDVPAHQHIVTLKGHTDRVTSAAFLNGDATLASCSSDGTIKLWDLAHALHVPTWNVSPNEYSYLPAVFSPDNRLLAVSDGKENIGLWNVTSQKRSGGLLAHNGAVCSIVFSPDGRFLAAIARNPTHATLRIWDLTTRSVIRTFPYLEAPGQLAWSRDGAFLAMVEQHKQDVRLWQTATWTERGTPFFHSNDPLYCVAISPDNKILAIADDSTQNRIVLWDVRTNRQRGAVLKGHFGTIRDMSFSPDGKLLASCSFDRTIRLWDVVRAEEVLPALKGHRESIASVAFSPDGRTLASGGDDKTVRLWSMEAHREVATLHGHTGKITCVAFSPDGNTLVSTDQGGTVRLWRAGPGKEDAFLPRLTDGFPRPQRKETPSDRQR